MAIRYRDDDAIQTLWGSESRVEVAEDDWREARIELNLEEGRGDFRLEFHVSDVTDAKDDHVNLDDFRFEGCGEFL